MMSHENEQERAAMDRIRERLYNHVASLSMRDYRAAGNPKYSKKTGQRVHIPYSLGMETTEAHDVYKLSLQDVWNDETENRIKAYQMRRITFT